MKIQSINNVYCQKPLSFRGYKESMSDAIRANFNYKSEVNGIIKDLFEELQATEGTKKHPAFDILNEWISERPIAFIKEICEPLGKMKPTFRDLIIDSECDIIPILEKSDDNVVFLSNYGKLGFLNTLFNNQNAKNDIRLFLKSQDSYLELSMTKRGNIVLEQSHQGFWEKSYFNSIDGKKYLTKKGNAKIDLPPSYSFD